MRIVVAGGTGFLGQPLSEALRRRGHEVSVCSRRTGVDIRDFGQIDHFLEDAKPDVVVNAAAHVGGIAYNAQRPVAIYEDNLLIGLNLVRAAAGRAGKFVNIMPNCTYPGVAEVYSEPGWWGGPMDETVLTYGMPRKALWVQTWAYAKEGRLGSVHLVLPNLYGPGDHFDPVRSHALGALVRKIVDADLAGRSVVEIWGTGSPVREWMFVEDAAEGIVEAVEAYDSIDILNLGWGQGWSIRQIAERIRLVVGWRGDFVYDASRPDGAPRKVLDVSRMHARLKWRPRVDLEEGIRRTVEWYCNRREAEVQQHGY
jgi:nucleoside-diphosphate-sugar epimerase